MGRGWVHGIREASSAKKGKLFTKIAKEIAVAVKTGGSDSPDSNARLRTALEDARKSSMPKDTIDRAIKRGLGTGSEATLEEITYEGYGPHGVAVMVEALTDNRNRTVQDLRALFVRAKGALGETGSVAWMFDRIGSIVAKQPASKPDPEEAAIMAGANEVEILEDTQVHFIASPQDLDLVNKALVESGWEILKSELSYKAKTPKELSSEEEKDLQEFLNKIDDNDDVKKLHLAV